MFAGDVWPTSITRSPGSAWSRLRMAAQPPECRGTLEPAESATAAGGPLTRFLNQRLSNLDSPCGRTNEFLQDQHLVQSESYTCRRNPGAIGSFGDRLRQVQFAAEKRIVFYRQAERANISSNH